MTTITTILHGHRHIERLLQTDVHLAADIAAIREQLKLATPAPPGLPRRAVSTWCNPLTRLAQCLRHMV